MIRLFSYKMTHDNGFAPNPFYGILTLANCKPHIRKSKRIGDWIAGFTSKSLCNEKVGEERLVFLMRINEKLTFKEYWMDKRFQNKKPNSFSAIARIGDNIYEPLTEKSISVLPEDFKQHRNLRHTEQNKKDDLKGEYVLVSSSYYYFGAGAIPVDKFRPSIPNGQSQHGVLTKDQERVKQFLDYIEKQYPQSGLINYPYYWPE